MFYSQLLLAKRGPLGRLWMAAHNTQANKGLNKAAITQTDIKTAAGAFAAPVPAPARLGLSLERPRRPIESARPIVRSRLQRA